MFSLSFMKLFRISPRPGFGVFLLVFMLIAPAMLAQDQSSGQNTHHNPNAVP